MRRYGRTLASTALALLTGACAGSGVARPGAPVAAANSTAPTVVPVAPDAAGGTSAPAAPAAPADARRTDATSVSSTRLPLAGRVVVLDPGHDGGNSGAAAIARQVPDGTGGTKECDTSGASTADGYPEHAFTWDVALRAAALLRARGARVVLTRPDDNGVGPCVDRRAALGNTAHADAVVSIHADGGPGSGRGFHVILGTRGPVSRGRLATVSRDLAGSLRAGLRRRTGTDVADYTAGRDGVDARGDLAGLNLSTVPKVFVECANMRNAADARLLRDPRWRQRVAQGLDDGLARVLR